MKDIFLSHNGNDKPWVEKLAFDIENDSNGNPIQVFFDKWDIEFAENIPQALNRGLEESRFLGLVLTPDSMNSRWVGLEWATKIMEDPLSEKKTIIPILRKKCDIPIILKPINYIDFTNDDEYNENLKALLSILRGEKKLRGKAKDFNTVNHQEDLKLLEKHLVVFNRPGFRVSCIWELFIRELIECIDDTQAALNTGKLFRRDKVLSNEFSPTSGYRTEEFQNTFKSITSKLTELKFQVSLFETEFKRNNPDYSHHQNFYAMLLDLGWAGNKSLIKMTVDSMDKIDRLRNEILRLINDLIPSNSTKKFEEIQLSSEIIKEGRIGGIDKIKSILYE